MKKIITTLVAMIVLMTSHAGELFVKMNTAPGSYYASLDDQMIYNKTGVFRFFDVNGGQHNLVIRNQFTHMTVASVPVHIVYNQRLIGEINMHGQFQIIASEQLNYISWYAQHNPYVHQIPPAVFPHPTNCGNGMNQFNVLSDKDFQQFLTRLNGESFDSGRLTTAKNFVRKTRMSSDQIYKIADGFTFDDSRLDFAKFAYDFCYDPINYYKLDDAFTFQSNVEALNKFIASK